MLRSSARVAAAVFVAAFLVLRPVPALPADGLLGSLFSDLNLVSPQQEAEISQQLARDIESKQPMLRDPEVEDYVQDLGNRLVGVLKDPVFRYRFRVVADRGVNAFGIGGGRIYLNAGLLAVADSEGQVAAVLAHEIGHQVRRHVAKQISRQAVFENLARAAMGSNASQWINLAASLGVTTGQLYFGREAERDADRVMVDLMPAAGYHPREALAMFDKLRALEGRNPGMVSEIFSSHPPTAERSANISQWIARKRLPAGLIRDSRRFQDIHRRILDEPRRR